MRPNVGPADPTGARRRGCGARHPGWWRIAEHRRAPEGHLFAGFTYSGVRFFADASLAMVDIGERAATYFDVKEAFRRCGASCDVSEVVVPRRLLDHPRNKRVPDHRRSTPEATVRLSRFWRNYCSWPTEQTFATTIAFIPWNWQRTNRDTVAVFRQNSGKLSVCVHGCDHTGGEFAARSAELLDRKLKTARCRMQSLLNKTALTEKTLWFSRKGQSRPRQCRLSSEMASSRQ